MIDNIQAASIKNEIQSVDNIVIIPHLNPDGDAMGSSLGLYQVLKNTGKDVQVITPTAYPNFLSWMHGADQAICFEEGEEKAKAVLRKAELLIFVDFNSLKRAGDLKPVVEALSVRKLMIDHHPYPEDIADVMVSVPAASSTCELAFNVVNHLGWNKYVNTEAAECFYTGIMTDTGSLSYNSSNPETYEIVAGLLKKNIDKDRIHQLVFHSNSISRMRLLGHVLSKKMFLMPDQEAAYLFLDKKELKDFNFQQGDTEGFVNYPLGIEGINISAFFMERDDKIKCSFRSRGDFPVNMFSELNFNGGGHRNAAGGESFTTLELSIDKFKTELPLFYEKYKRNEL